jgi:hypothetical protein
MLFLGMGLAWGAYAVGYYGFMMLKGSAGPGVTGGLSLKQVFSPVGYYTGTVSPFKPGAGAGASTSSTDNGKTPGDSGGTAYGGGGTGGVTGVQAQNQASANGTGTGPNRAAVGR